MPTALLAGAFGQGNLGDDALLQAFAGALPEWRMVATTSAPGIEEGDPERQELAPLEGVPSHRPLSVAGRALAADALIVGGGTIFKLLDPASGRRPRGLLANASALVGAASALRRPVAMVGVGAGDLRGSVATSYARFLVRHSDLLILRDEESAERLTASGVPGPFRVGADPAWTLLDPPDSSHVPPCPRVLVVPSRDAGATMGGREGLAGQLVPALQRLRSSGLEIVLQAWQHDQIAGLFDDVAMVAELERRLGPPIQVLQTPGALGDAVEPMKSFGVVLTYRFHALIAAGAAGTPIVAVGHEPKLVGLARRLGQPAVSPTSSPTHLADAVLDSVGSAGPAPAVVKSEIERAEEGFRLLRILLAGGSDESDRLGALPLVAWPD